VAPPNTTIPLPDSESRDSNPPVGVIVGGVVGGFAFLVILFVLCFCLYRRRNAGQASSDGSMDRNRISDKIVDPHQSTESYGNIQRVEADGSRNEEQTASPTQGAVPDNSLEGIERPASVQEMDASRRTGWRIPSTIPPVEILSH
jgi:hypothetical protein